MEKKSRHIEKDSFETFCRHQGYSIQTYGTCLRLVFANTLGHPDLQPSFQWYKQEYSLLKPLVNYVGPSYVIEALASDFTTADGRAYFNSMFDKHRAEYLWVGVSKKEEEDIRERITGHRFTFLTFADLKVDCVSRVFESEMAVQRKTDEKLYESIMQHIDAPHPLFVVNGIGSVRDPLYGKSWFREKLAEHAIGYATVDLAPDMKP